MLESRWGSQMKHFLKVSHKHASILCYEVVLAHSSRLQAESFCAARCLRVSIYSLFTGLVNGYSAGTCSWLQSALRSHRTSNTLSHLDAPLQGETFLIDSRINILHSSRCHMQSTMESCSLLLKRAVPSCPPSMLSKVYHI